MDSAASCCVLLCPCTRNRTLNHFLWPHASFISGDKWNWKKENNIFCILVTFCFSRLNIWYPRKEKHLWWSNSFLTTWNPSWFSRHSFIHSQTELWLHTVQQELPMILISITTKWSKLVIIHSLLDQKTCLCSTSLMLLSKLPQFENPLQWKKHNPPNVLESPLPSRSYMKVSAWVKPSYIREIQHRHLMVNGKESLMRHSLESSRENYWCVRSFIQFWIHTVQATWVQIWNHNYST